MLVLRALARLVGTLLMLVLALVGLGVALYCFDGFISLGSARPDRLLHLPSVRRHIGHFLARLTAPGSTAALALVCGLGAMVIGLLLLAGTLRSRRERLAVLDRDPDHGTLAAKSRTLREMSRALAEQTPGATSVKRPQLNLSRRGARGRLNVTVSRAPTSDRTEVQRAVVEQLEPLSGPFGLRARVRVLTSREGQRVQ
ncbi:MAG: hypothetical protein ACR2NR_11100 [Solirubrobacteraceae bacterium]